MKKLFRQEWKYYLFFLVATVCWLCWNGARFNQFFLYIVHSDSDAAFRNLETLSSMEWTMGVYVNDLTTGVVASVLFSILLLKGCIFWVEKNSYGREFLQTLPVKRVDRMRFHLLMDSLFIVVVLAIYGSMMYMYMHRGLAMVEIELPWLEKSVAGLIVTDICYLLFLLGIISFLECLFVNGAARFFGIISCMGLSAYIVTWMFTNHESNTLLQKLFGFLFLQSPGNRTYLVGRPWLGIDKPWMRDPFVGWTHASLTPDILYQGKPIEYTLERIFDNYSYSIETKSLSTLYDFSIIGSYVWYALAYAAIAIILAGVSIKLYEKQELSKDGVYFPFAKYLLSALISGEVFLFVNAGTGKVWHTCISVAAVLVFIILIVLMSPDGRKRFFAKPQR